MPLISVPAISNDQINEIEAYAPELVAQYKQVLVDNQELTDKINAAIEAHAELDAATVNLLKEGKSAELTHEQAGRVIAIVKKIVLGIVLPAVL